MSDVETQETDISYIDEALKELESESNAGFRVPGVSRLGAPEPDIGTHKAARINQAAGHAALAEYGQLPQIPEKVDIFTRSVKNLVNGVRLGLVGEVETFDHLAKIFSRATGLPETEALQKVMDWGRPTDEDLAAGGSSLYDKVVRSVGHAIPLIAQLAVGSGAISAGLKATKLPSVLKLGSKAATGGKRLLTAEKAAHAQGLAKAAGKTLKGTVPLAEPLAFGAYEATHEAVRPEATIGSTIGRTMEGLAMGTALPLFRGLPHGLREAAPAVMAGGMTRAGGGTGEEALVSGITMGTLAGLPEAGKRLKRGRATPEPSGPSILDVSEEAKGKAGGILNDALGKAGYNPQSYQNWSTYQKQTVLGHTFRGTGGKSEPLKIDFDQTSGIVNIKVGDWKIAVPRENPKAIKKAPIPTPTVAGKDKLAAETGGELKGAVTESPKETGELERLGEQELMQRVAYSVDRDSRIDALSELERRRNAVDKAKRDQLYTGPDGAWTGAMKYIREVLGDRKEITATEVGDIIEKELIQTGWNPSVHVDAFMNYLTSKGYRIVAAKEAQGKVDIEGALNDLMKGAPEQESAEDTFAETRRTMPWLGEGGPPPSKETIAEKQGRMRKWADEFLANKKEEEALGGPEIGTEEGVRTLQREAIGGVKGKTLRGGVKTSTTGGLRGRIPRPEERLFKTVVDMTALAQKEEPRIPTGSEDAYAYGTKLRQQKQFGVIDKLWTKYIEENEAFKKAESAERKTTEFRQRVIENSLRKEIVETYYRAPKNTSMAVDKVAEKVAAERGTVVTKPTGKVYSQATKPGNVILLKKKDAPNVVPTTDFERRAQLLVEAGKIEPKWHKMALRDFSDEALELIVKHEITPTMTWITGGAKAAAVKLGLSPEEAKVIAARIPSSGKETIHTDVEAIKDHLHTKLGYSKALVNMVDWDKVLKLQAEGWKMEDIEGPKHARQGEEIKKVAFGEEMIDATEDPSTLRSADRFTLAEGWTGVDPELLTGPMIRLVLEGKGMSFKEAMRRLQNWKGVPKAPEGVYKGYEPPPHKVRGVSDDTLADWFEGQLIRASGEAKLRKAYKPETEEQLIREALPGLQTKNLEDPSTATAARTMADKIIAEFRTNRKADTFAGAAKSAFVKAWKGMKYADKSIKAKLLEDVTAILDVEPVETGEGFLGPGGAPYKPGKTNPSFEKMEQAVEAMQTSGRLFKQDIAPVELTEADRLLNEANKISDTFRNYKDVLELAAKDSTELRDVSKEIFLTRADRDAAAGGAPETLAPIDAKLAGLKDRQSQLLVDIEYLMGLKDWFARTGKPYTGKEVYLEEELNEKDHGINGTVVSKAMPKGATFYIIQNPSGGPGVVGAPGNKLYAKAEIVSRRTKGEVATWEIPDGMDARAEDALYNDILERFMWRTKPIAITNAKGVAEAVASRRVDDKYSTAKMRPDAAIMSLLPEDSAAYKEMKKKIHDSLIAAAKDVEGKEIGTYTRQKRQQFLERAQSLGDVTFGYDLENLYTAPSKLGISDPAFNASRVEFVPLLERIGDPTQSRIAPIAYVGNLAEQANLSIANYMKQYMLMADEYLGKFKDDPLAKQKIMRHLIANSDTKIRAKHPDWISGEADILESARGYRLIMEDLAQLFNLREKGLYRENYATINYDINKLWDLYAKKFAKTTKPSELPDSLLSKLDPADYYNLRDYATSGKTWDQLDDVAQTFIMDKFFKYNTAYATWEQLPEAARARIPKQKFIKYFQHRTTDDIMDFALNEDIWDVTTNYITSVVHDGVMSDFFLPKSRVIVRNIPALGVGETTSVRGYLDNYIKQVAGFNRNTPATQFMDSLAKTFNQWVGKPVLPESGMLAEGANIYQQWLYRGALGIDTAVRNLTQSIYTIAELGAHNWLKGLKGYIEHGWKKDEPWQKYDAHRRLIEEFFERQTQYFKKSNPTMYEKWRTLDQKVTALALSPMRITEHINRGVAYFAGLAEAAQQGVNFNTAHVVGLKRATQYTHPYEMSEAEWRATNKMYKTQFGYGKVHQAPIFSGPAASWFKAFLTFPTRSLNFASNLGKESLGIERWGEAVGKGSAEIWLNSDKAQLTRFLALSGFMALAPQLLASTLGIDTGYLWGKGLFPNQMTPMWMGMAEDFYTGILGGTGMAVPPDAKDKMDARRRLSTSSLMLLIPQWRFAQKTGRVMDNIERGYYAMGPKDLPAKETTFMKELVNLLGFPPYTKDAKQLVWDAYKERGDTSIQKATALKEAAERYHKKDFQGATKILNNTAQKHGVRISEQDILDYIHYQETTSAYEAAEKQMTHELKPKWSGALQSAERKHLPHGVGRTRSFWVNSATTESETPPIPGSPSETEEDISDPYTLMSLIGEEE